MDFSNPRILKECIDFLKSDEMFGTECTLYGVGFSMGGNHLLRYLGSVKEELGSDSGLKSAITIGNPFDCLSTGLQLKYTLYGIYDSVLRKSISKPFVLKRFRQLRNLSEEHVSQMKQSKTLYEFDQNYRAKFFAYSSVHKLYRGVSCGPYLPNVDIPFLVLLSNDDPITKVELVPHGDLLRN